MQIEIKVPTIGESINEVTLAKWLKNDGDMVQQDEMLCELESEKATFELNAEKAGRLSLVAKEGDVLKIGDVVCRIEVSEQQAVSNEQPEVSNRPVENSNQQSAVSNRKEEQQQPAEKIQAPEIPKPQTEKNYAQNIPSPSADKIIRETGIPVENGTGKSGRITKADALNAVKNKKAPRVLFSRNDRRERMSSLRKTVSKHLVNAKNSTAMLTTFNEVDMKAIMDIRTKFKDSFKEKFSIGLGFMSFFTKACCFALQEFPAVNAFIDGEEIIYHDYCDISIAVSTPKGLVVPVIQNAESLSFADIEKKVADLAKRGRENKLQLEEMNGGTFTITNGGVFGSLMSTPIINLPQSAILGMHKIQERVIVIDGGMAIRPMMYLALSYDHRIVDGKESVSFLVRVKEMLEHPDRLLIGNDPVKEMLDI